MVAILEAALTWAKVKPSTISKYFRKDGVHSSVMDVVAHGVKECWAMMRKNFSRFINVSNYRV